MDFYYWDKMEIVLLAQVTNIEKKKTQIHYTLRENLIRLSSHKSLVCKDFSLSDLQIKGQNRLLTIIK